MNDISTPRFTLPPAFSGDKTMLSEAARKEIITLFGAQPVAFLTKIFTAWAVIFCSIGLAIYLNSIPVSILAIFIIATRMNVFALLVHEQTHFLGLRGKYGDTIVNLLVSYPLILLDVENYAKVHLSHHKYYFTDRDPDFQRKSGLNWFFPMKASHLAGLFLQDALGLTVWQIIKGKKSDNSSLFPRPYPTPRWVRPTFYVAVAIFLSVFQAWGYFLLYWLLPLVTIMPMIVRLGALTEHIYGLENGGLIETTPIIVLSWWEQLLLPNLNFTLHVYHHYYPNIAFNNLPKVHAIYERENLLIKENIFHGYASYLKHLLSIKNAQESPVTEQ